MKAPWTRRRQTRGSGCQGSGVGQGVAGFETFMKLQDRCRRGILRGSTRVTVEGLGSFVGIERVEGSSAERSQKSSMPR
jgi:hypothetical protein